MLCEKTNGKAKWHGIKCSDCRTVIAYSPTPVNLHQLVYCSLCANAHAQVADWLMPVGNSYGTSGLYGVQTDNFAHRKGDQFRRLWNNLFARLQAHQVAKAENKNHRQVK